MISAFFPANKILLFAAIFYCCCCFSFMFLVKLSRSFRSSFCSRYYLPTSEIEASEPKFSSISLSFSKRFFCFYFCSCHPLHVFFLCFAKRRFEKRFAPQRVLVFFWSVCVERDFCIVSSPKSRADMNNFMFYQSVSFKKRYFWAMMVVPLIFAV